MPEYLRSNAVRNGARNGGDELRRLIPALACGDGVVPQRLVRKEEEQMIANNRAAQTAGKLVEPAFITLHWVMRSVPPLVRVQSRPVGLHHGAPVELVGAILRHHQHLSAAIASIGGIVGVRHHSYFLHRLLVRRDDGGPAPGKAVHLDTINLKAVRGVPRAVRAYLHLVFGLKNTARSACTAWACVARQIL